MKNDPRKKSACQKQGFGMRVAPMPDNTVNLPFKDAEEFRDYIGRKDVGDTCRITVDFQITDIGDDNVSGVVSKPGLAPGHGMAEVEMKSDGDENSPVMMVIKRGSPGKSRAAY